jgi:hypothetical protein
LPFERRSYHSAVARHSRPVLLLAAATLVVAGCSSRLDFDGDATGSIAAATPAVVDAAAPAAVPAAARAEAAGDWDTVRRRVTAVPPPPVGKPDVPPVVWENAESGNSGTITGLIASSSASGRACRNFSATRSSLDGVRAYRAEVCRVGTGWEYTRLEPLDRADEARPKG